MDMTPLFFAWSVIILFLSCDYPLKVVRNRRDFKDLYVMSFCDHIGTSLVLQCQIPNLPPRLTSEEAKIRKWPPQNRTKTQFAFRSEKQVDQRDRQSGVGHEAKTLTMMCDSCFCPCIKGEDICWNQSTFSSAVLPHAYSVFFSIFRSRFLSSNQHFRWSAAPNARCLGGQGLRPLASGRLTDQYLLETIVLPATLKKKTRDPENCGKPLRRSAAAINVWFGYSALTGPAHVPLQPSSCCLHLPISMWCAVAPPRLKEYGCHLNVGRRANCTKP